MLATGFAVDEDYRLDDALTRERGAVFLSGTQAFARLALMQRHLDAANGLNTAGFITGYRGSPVAGVDLALWRAKALLDRAQIRFQPGLNEALAATSVLGSQQVEAEGSALHDGVFAFWYGKGPGIDWAGDAIKHGNAYGSSPHGGVLVIAGDDHGAVSSTMAHQSDQVLQSWYLPVLHPATIAEYLELGLYGIALSRYSGAWVGMKAISETVEGASSLVIPAALPHFHRPGDHAVPPGGLSFRWNDPPSVALEARLQAKIAAAEAFARANPVDRRITDPDHPRLGIVTVGKAHQDVMEAFRMLGFAGPGDIEALGVRIYKIAQTWPIEREGLLAATGGLETLLVVEEKRPFVEEQIKSLLYGMDASRRPAVFGKTDDRGAPMLPAFGELRPTMLMKPIAERLEHLYPNLELAPTLDRHAFEPAPRPELRRVPHFCSGCPHNSSTVLPEGAKAFGGIGCHIMATWMGRSTRGVTQMGGEGSNWIGLSPFVEREHMFQNLGDGTFYHSGSLGIRAAVAAKSRITFKILFNDAVAMTGGQPHDGPLDPARITRQVHEEGVRRIAVVSDDPTRYPANTDWAPGVKIFHRDMLEKVQEDLAAHDGVSVLVYDQTCAAEKRRRRKKGLHPDPARRAVINTLVCEACGDCSKKSNCLSVQPVRTEFGIKRQIDQSSCNKDYSCQDGFCPSFVTVEGGQLRKGAGLEGREIDGKLASVPHPRLPAIEQTYEILVTGIGGTGVLTVGAVIGMAAHLESRPASVLDFTGLAQKGGAVLSHVRIASSREYLNQSRIEPRQAHAMIACDLVVAADRSALETLREGRTRIAANVHVTATAGIIRDPAYDIHTERLIARIEKRAGARSLSTIDAHRLALAVTGDAIGANMLLLGFAWQKQLLPFTLRAMERAIELNGVAVAANLRAFAFGRLAAHDPAWLENMLDDDEVEPQTLDELVAHRASHLEAYQNRAYARRYRDFVSTMAEHDTELGMTVARQLFRLMAYKDEYEVARLFTDGRFKAEIDSAFEGDFRLRYHMAPPALSFLRNARGEPRKLAPGSWMTLPLRVLAALKGLRGTVLDPFGMNVERRKERQLIETYRTDLERLVAAGDIGRARSLAALPDVIRGFGHIKIANIVLYEQRRARLLAPPERVGPEPLAVAAE